MAKNHIIKRYNEKTEDDIDFFDDVELLEDEAISGMMMDGLIEASNHQMRMAFELTKLVVENSREQRMSEDNIFSIFKKASKVVSESFNLKEL